jgi:hypothetical protein
MCGGTLCFCFAPPRSSCCYYFSQHSAPLVSLISQNAIPLLHVKQSHLILQDKLFLRFSFSKIIIKRVIRSFSKTIFSIYVILNINIQVVSITNN